MGRKIMLDNLLASMTAYEMKYLMENFHRPQLLRIVEELKLGRNHDDFNRLDMTRLLSKKHV